MEQEDKQDQKKADVEREIYAQSLKNPGIAAIASFVFAGFGQAYNGEFLKAALFFVVQSINVVLLFLIIGWVTYPVVMGIAVYDAYKSAQLINENLSKKYAE